MDYNAILSSGPQTGVCTEEDANKSVLIDLIGVDTVNALSKIPLDDIKKACLILSAREWKNGTYYPTDKRAVTRKMTMNPLSAIICGGVDKSNVDPMFIGRFNYATQLPRSNLKVFAVDPTYVETYREMTNIGQLNQTIKKRNLASDHAAGYLQWLHAARGDDNNNNYAALFSTLCHYDCAALKTWKFAHIFPSFDGKYFIEPTSSELNVWHNSIVNGTPVATFDEANLVVGTWRETDRVAVTNNINNNKSKCFVYKHLVKDQASWSQMISVLPFAYRSAEFHNGEALFSNIDLKNDKYRIANYATFMNERVKFSFLKTHFKVLYEQSKGKGSIDWIGLKHLFGWVLPLAHVPETVKLNGTKHKVAALGEVDIADSVYEEPLTEEVMDNGFTTDDVQMNSEPSVDSITSSLKKRSADQPGFGGTEKK
jgi:hypothetical protein